MLPAATQWILLRSERFRELKINLPGPASNTWATFIRGHGNDSNAFSQLEGLTVTHNPSRIDVTFTAATRLRRMKAQIPIPSWGAGKALCSSGTAEVCRDKSLVLGPAIHTAVRRFQILSARIALCGYWMGFFVDFNDRLRFLRYFTFVGASDDHVKLLRHTSSLVHLHAITHTDDPLLIGLMAMNQSDPLVPELKQLTIQPDRWTRLSRSVGPLLTMVFSRTTHLHASGCGLEHLTIVIPNRGLRLW